MNQLSQTLKLFGAATVVGLAAFGAHSMAENAIRKARAHACMPVEVSVYFAPGQFELNGFAENLLNQAMSEVEHCSLSKIEVTGFADSTGRADQNMKLSEQRADAAMQFIITQGVEAELIEVEAKGADGAVLQSGEPLVMRRKVDIRLIPQKPSV
jgi:outer membrane protein OmpA-like peptidoglycan-associated protein